MKHRIAVAELNGWITAVADAVNTGRISSETAEWLSGHSADVVRALLEGEVIAGFSLDSATAIEDDQMFEEVLGEINAEKQGYPNVN